MRCNLAVLVAVAPLILAGACSRERAALQQLGRQSRRDDRRFRNLHHNEGRIRCLVPGHLRPGFGSVSCSADRDPGPTPGKLDLHRTDDLQHPGTFL